MQRYVFCLSAVELSRLWHFIDFLISVFVLTGVSGAPIYGHFIQCFNIFCGKKSDKYNTGLLFYLYPMFMLSPDPINILYY